MSRLRESARGEEWRPLIGYEGIYEISNFGSIRSLTRVVPMKDGRTKTVAAKILKRRIDDKGSGYVYTSLCRDGVTTKSNVHQLVLLSFVGPPNGLWALHRDGDRANSALTNLYYGTPAQNSKDMVRHGNSLRGEDNHESVLTQELVQWIKESRQSSIELGLAIGVHHSTIRSVRTGRNWGWMEP